MDQLCASSRSLGPESLVDHDVGIIDIIVGVIAVISVIVVFGVVSIVGFVVVFINIVVIGFSDVDVKRTRQIFLLQRPSNLNISGQVRATKQ